MPSQASLDDPHNINFYIAEDPLCQNIVQTNIGASSANLRLYYYESQARKADALSMTLVMSIALSAANNRLPVNVIYEKINSTTTHGFFLVALQQVNNYPQ